jgi:hypothetical protein
MIATHLVSEESKSPLETLCTVHEALNGPKAAESAMVHELETLRNQETWELVKRPENCNVIGCKWVFTVKTINGRIIRLLYGAVSGEGRVRDFIPNINLNKPLRLANNIID